MKKSTGDRDMAALVVEAEPVSFGAGNEIPKDSVEALHGILAAGGPGWQRAVGGNLQASGFRLLTDNVLDASEPSRLQHMKAVPHHGVLTALWPRQLLQSIAVSMTDCIL